MDVYVVTDDDMVQTVCSKYELASDIASRMNIGRVEVFEMDAPIDSILHTHIDMLRDGSVVFTGIYHADGESCDRPILSWWTEPNTIMMMFIASTADSQLAIHRADTMRQKLIDAELWPETVIGSDALLDLINAVNDAKL